MFPTELSNLFSNFSQDKEITHLDNMTPGLRLSRVNEPDGLRVKRKQDQEWLADREPSQTLDSWLFQISLRLFCLSAVLPRLEKSISNGVLQGTDTLTCLF